MPLLSPALRATAMPPIPAARVWASRYGGGAGPAIDLTQAVPGYPPHPELLARLAKEAGCAASAGYGAIEGDDALRGALAEEISGRYGGDIGRSDVLITAGCNLAFAMAASCVAAPGEAVMLPAPWYFNHHMALTMHGIASVALPCVAEDGFLPDPERAEALLHDGVRAIVLISPNNPTGAVYPAELLARFVALCRRRRLWLILDETYRDFLPGVPHALFGDPDWSDVLVQLYSFSKAYCIPGHRLGAIVAGSAFRAELVKVLDTLQICAPRAAQAAIAWAIPALRGWRRGNADIMAGRAGAFHSAMAAAPDWRIDALGGYFAYLRIPDQLPDAMPPAKSWPRRTAWRRCRGRFSGRGRDGICGWPSPMPNCRRSGRSLAGWRSWQVSAADRLADRARHLRCGRFAA